CVGRDRRAAARTGALTDLDLLFGLLRRQRVGAQAVDADLVVVVAEREQGRRAIDEPVATGLVGRAVHRADGFEGRHHGPADIGYGIDRIAFVSGLRADRSARYSRCDEGRSDENGRRLAGHALPLDHASLEASESVPPHAHNSSALTTFRLR